MSYTQEEQASHTTSRELAEKFDVRHSNLVRMIRSMVERQEIKAKESYYKNHPTGKKYVEFHLKGTALKRVTARLDSNSYLIRRATQAEEATPARRVHTPAFGLPYVGGPVTPVADKFAISYRAPADDQVDQVLTMSSLEIHELTGKSHAHVMRDIRKLLDELGIPESKFGSGYLDAQNQQRPCFNLPRREVDILLTGYSTLMRAKVIDRWHVLEAQVAKPVHQVPTSFLEAMKLATDLEEKRLQLTHQVEVQAEKIEKDKPKIQVFEKLIEQKGVTNFQTFCTQLNLHQRKVKEWLRDIGWLRANQWEVNPLPTAKAVDAGYCDIKRFRTDSGRLKQQIVFTNKAEAYVELKAPAHIRKPVRKERKKAA